MSIKVENLTYIYDEGMPLSIGPWMMSVLKSRQGLCRPNRSYRFRKIYPLSNI